MDNNNNFTPEMQQQNQAWEPNVQVPPQENWNNTQSAQQNWQVSQQTNYQQQNWQAPQGAYQQPYVDQFAADPEDLKWEKYLNPKAAAIMAYIPAFWVIAILASDYKNNKFIRFHMNQGLILSLFMMLVPIPIVGWIWGIFLTVCMVMGIVNANGGKNKQLPLIGKLTLIK